MANIHGINPMVPANNVDPVGAASAAKAAANFAASQDVVEISTVTRLSARIAEIPEVRTELVERVKAEIAAGTYETPEKLDIAVTRLMEELFPEL